VHEYNAMFRLRPGIINGTAGCRALFEDLVARDFSDYRFFGVHRFMVDAYALQHPDEYCASAKSLMAHLGGLRCAMEHGGEQIVYQTLQKSLNGRLSLKKPGLPRARGELTIEHLRGISDPDAYKQAIAQWGRCVWAAYSGLHDFGREWLRRALAANKE